MRDTENHVYGLHNGIRTIMPINYVNPNSVLCGIDRLVVVYSLFGSHFVVTFCVEYKVLMPTLSLEAPVTINPVR